MGACWTKENRGDKLDAKEEKLDGCELNKDGEDQTVEKAGKAKAAEDTPEEAEFRARAAEIKSDNEATNVISL